MIIYLRGGLNAPSAQVRMINIYLGGGEGRGIAVPPPSLDSDVRPLLRVHD